MFNDSGCVAAEDSSPACGDAVPPGAPVDLCRAHLIKAYLFMKQELAEIEPRTTIPGLRPVSVRDSRKSLVYYIRFGDRIKIGTTADLCTRLAHLPHDELLALEPGDAVVERGRHLQFRAHHVSGDWFVAVPEITAHAARLRVKHFALFAEAAR